MDRLTPLRVFVSVVEQGSLSGAGEKLDCRAPLWRAIWPSWRVMGARLLHRTTRRLSLTGPGEEALNRARAMLAQGEEMEQIAVKGNDGPKGELRITSIYSLSEALLVGAANDYLAQYPGTATDPAAGQNRQSGGSPTWHTCHSVVCASPDYLANHPAPQRVQDWRCTTASPTPTFGKSLWEFNGPSGTESVLGSACSHVLGLALSGARKADPAADTVAAQATRCLRGLCHPKTDVTAATQLPRFPAGPHGGRPALAGVKTSSNAEGAAKGPFFN